MVHGRLVTERLDSAALRGNPLGDPAERTVMAWLPPSQERGARLPAVYFLHGFGGSAQAFANVAAFTPSLPERIDRLVGSGALPEFAAVFVDGWTSLGGSQWVNSQAIGRYRDYLVQDVVPFAERAWGLLPSAGARAVAGKSSGGYGALVMARHHPDVFAHVACHAGDMGFDYCYLPDLPLAAGALLGTDAVAWLGEMQRRGRETRLRGEDRGVVNVLAMAAAYSPEAGAPLGIALPFDAETGALRPEVWARWLAHDPVRFVPQSLDAFRRLRTLYLDCGTRDEFRLRWGARMVARSLREAGIAVLHEEFDDGHRGIDYRFARSLSLIVPRLDRGPP
jgi:S-formylglutathione hydrolase FrmB